MGIPRKSYQPKPQLIPNQQNPNAGYPSFSFKYTRLTHEKFKIDDRDEKYFLKLLTRLQNLSQMKKQELVTSTSAALRCHTIDWRDTSETCFGIPNEALIVDKPWQFSISSNEHGRVMGFFIGDIFYVVWFDPNHDLYSGRKR